MKRADVLAQIVAAGYEGDNRKALRLFVEHRISYQAYVQAWRMGADQRERENAAGGVK